MNKSTLLLLDVMNSLGFYIDLRQSDIDCLDYEDYNGKWIACFFIKYEDVNKIGGPWSGKALDMNTAISDAAINALTRLSKGV
jgi:hypothetical protein